LTDKRKKKEEEIEEPCMHTRAQIEIRGKKKPAA
jgi:hypothetical protein